MDTLNATQLAEYKEVFSMFDRDGDGTVDATELGVVMGSLGVNPSDAEIQQMIEEVDTDGNGTIDFGEFCALMVNKTKSADPEEELQTVFGMMDKDQDGVITLDDLEQVVAAVQWGADRPPRQEDLEAMLQLFNANGAVTKAILADIVRS
jgi:calmodulin